MIINPYYINESDVWGREKKTNNKTQKLKTLSFILRHINHGFGVVQDTKGQY